MLDSVQRANQFFSVFVRIWILLSALLTASGWLLSAFQLANGAGYTIMLVLTAGAILFWQRKSRGRPDKSPGRWVVIHRQRFKRLAPMLFLVLALLILLGGLLYPPVNGSSTAYRIPRVMHWLAAGRWHWIHTLDVRMNIAGCGYEWFCAPLILLTRSDRLLFLPNWLSFLLLPGLIYSLFTRLGVRPRVAWWWMWLLPSGWCFIFQAGSTINDAFATAYALASVDFALRARLNKKTGDLWLALLAAALATGVKQTGILLAVPALLAVWPSRNLLFNRPLASLAVATACLLVSALPTMIHNTQHTGNWSGVTPESWGKEVIESPFWGLIGNTFCLATQNLKPPLFPFADAWNAARMKFLHTPFGAHFLAFENFGYMSFGISETTAGIGSGITILMLISLGAARCCRRMSGAAPAANSRDPFLRLLRWVPWGLVLVFMARVSTFENQRLLAPYYILLFPALLASPGQSVLVHRPWWQSLARLVLVLAAGLLVISRDRPLFPSQTVVGWLAARHPNAKLVSNMSRTYAETPAAEKQRLRLWKNIPPGEAILGYAAADLGGLAETPLWLPFGRRQIQRVLPEDTPEQLRSAGIHYVLVQRDYLLMTHDTIEQWLARYGGVLLTQWESLQDPYAPPEGFYLVRLQ